MGGWGVAPMQNGAKGRIGEWANGGGVWLRFVKKKCAVRVENGDFEAGKGILSARGGFVRLLRVLASFGLTTSRGGGVARMERGD